jgi:GNAT superfamily N-acetyltransferase
MGNTGGTGRERYDGEVEIGEVTRAEAESLIPILLLAEPEERALRYGLDHLNDTFYRMRLGGRDVAAATLQWRRDPAEIGELAVVADMQGRGLGRRMLRFLADEARRRGKSRLLVGTPNSNLDSIAFYQRCGLRMDHVRRDFFDYYARYFGGPRSEHGIPTRDMLVFSDDLRAGGG